MDKSGLLKRETPISISLSNGRRRSSDRNTGFVYAKIVEAGQIYWPELKALVENASPNLSDERLTTIVEELLPKKH